ncbi:MAG TPA: polyamine ABC transporter ATP-binding protein [Lentisphaeria bacterium]|nr:MAG: polyamine ABC transporter ATP-binding protein [Lentisphaerae bacterium GWF2_49_21]HBC88157.1 polyamine ABC transporter ATP-binding protein [Lentisphaeria bacterium]
MDENKTVPMIQAKDLTVGYGDVVVLENLNFSIERGEVFVIIGGSGCGKSTILKHLIGLYEPMKGDILIKGESIVKADWEEKRRLMKSFGVLYQAGALFSALTIAENIALPMEEYTKYSEKEIMQHVNEKLKLVGLQGAGPKMPSELSGGMKKRAALARAMALDPEILFFDEPSTSLDPVTAAMLDRLILDLRDRLGTTMVIVTHDLDSIYAISDRVIMLDKEAKTIVARGKPSELRKSNPPPAVKEFLERAGLSRKMD